MPSLASRNSLLLLATLACGSPSPLDLERFPSRAESGYGGSRQTGSAGTPSNSGTGNSGTAGTPSVVDPTGGSGGAGGTQPDLPVAGTASDNGGSGGTQDVGTAGTDVQSGGSGGTVDEACNALPLFARSGDEGGCGDFTCHGGLIPPDLVSPGVADRLLSEISTCNDRPYLSADDSFVIDKLSPDPECNAPMPLGQSISDADRDCMIEWLNAVAGGG